MTEVDSRSSVFTFEAPQIVFGPGCSSELGSHLARFAVTRALFVCDPFVVASGTATRLQEEAARAGVASEVYDGIAGEPNESSVGDAVAAARGRGYDGFVGVGGGSALDTAKLCALFATHEGALLDFVNRPVGEGRPVPGPLRPLIAVPTTAGTGSEVTTVAIVDFPRLGAKTGISHHHLRPRLAIVDPRLALTCPPGVTAAVGLDALLHALEAYTTLPYDRRPVVPPAERPPYQGAHPLADVLCTRAIGLVGANLRRAVEEPHDVEARSGMGLAATMAGMGFGSAGVHIPHALAYSIASLKHDWTPPGYGGGALVPHGFAVAVTAPATFRFIGDAVPERCCEAARLLDGGSDLAGSFERLMRDVGAPLRLADFGYVADDIQALVDGALGQQRLLVGSPKGVGRTDLEAILGASL